MPHGVSVDLRSLSKAFEQVTQQGCFDSISKVIKTLPNEHESGSTEQKVKNLHDFGPLLRKTLVYS